MEFKSPTGAPTFYRTYSRRADMHRESYADVVKRTTSGLQKLGKYTDEQYQLVRTMMEELKCLPSGRWMWIGGTSWIEKPENFYSAYNCNSTNINDLESFGLMMSLGMMGCGTGAVLEERYINQLPPVRNSLQVRVVGVPGQHLVRLEDTTVEVWDDDRLEFEVVVGDSRQGWVDSMMAVLELAFKDFGKPQDIKIAVDISSVRPDGTPIKGFGGVANPIQLSGMYVRLANVLNRYIGKTLDYEGVCLLLDEVALTIVAGNVRRYAGMRQFDVWARLLKQNLWMQDEQGNWKIDPDRDALRMSNHTRVYHHKPSEEECVEAVRSQYYSGEGAIQWAGEAVARANADLLNTDASKRLFLANYAEDVDKAREYLHELAVEKSLPMTDEELDHRMQRMGLNPCFAAGTMVLTKTGHYPIEKLVGHSVEIWDGDSWRRIDNFRVTAKNEPVYRLELSNGQSLVATAYHSFILEDGSRIQLKDLEEGDRLRTHEILVHGNTSEPAAYLKGFLVGDGTSTEQGVILHLYEPKYCCADRLTESASEIHSDVEPDFAEPCVNRMFMRGIMARSDELVRWVTMYRKDFPVEALNWNYESKLDFIAGVMDADGCACDTKNGFMYQISSIHKEWLLGFQLLLRTIGVRSKLALNKPGGYKDFGERGGICEVQPLYRLTISQASSIRLAEQVDFERLTNFSDKRVIYRLRNKEAIVQSIDFSHIADEVYCCTVEDTHSFALSNGLVVGQCGEIIGSDLMCNLAEIHLNQIDPLDIESQRLAFTAGGLSVAALLHHEFVDERYRCSRKLDPIVGVSFTGLFDFFVNAFGNGWLRWWQEGRKEWWDELYPAEWEHMGEIGTALGLPDDDEVWLDCDAALMRELEKRYLQMWRKFAQDSVWSYCDQHQLKRPNRYTTVQPAGTKSLLTGASAGWHPPKAQRYIRRITFAAYDPVAMACVDYGYTVVPSQSCKDENGKLLDDPYDSRVNEWLIEIPVEVPWANIPGADQIDISKFNIESQFNFYMQVQKHYTTHNTSGTLEIREHEIKTLGNLIYKAIAKDEGYISCAILARFDDKETFPRLPFEPIDKATYDELQQQVLNRRKSDDFHSLLEQYDKGWNKDQGVTGCDSDKCMMPERK